MSSATFIPWENHLAKLVRQPGGVKLAEALSRAEENLETIREDCIASIDAQLDVLERVCAEGGRRPADDAKLEIYQVSNDIIAVAGAAGLGELGRAAFSLCELVDRFRSLGAWNQAAIEVHLSACRLLRNPDPDADRSKVVEGLQQLTERVAAIAE